MNLEVIKKLETTLQKKLIEPELGFCPHFDMSAFKKNLESVFKTSPISITSTPLHTYKTSSNAKQKDVHTHSFCCDPIDGHLFIVMKKNQFSKLIEFILGDNKAWFPKTVESGFIDYIIVKTINALHDQNMLEGVHIKQTEQPVKPENIKSKVQVKLDFGFTTIEAECLIDTALYTNWRSHWRQKPVISLNDELTDQINVEVTSNIGHIEISPDVFKNVKPGDWIALKNTSLNLNGPTQTKLLHNGKHIGQGTLNDTSLEINQVSIPELNKVIDLTS